RSRDHALRRNAVPPEILALACELVRADRPPLATTSGNLPIGVGLGSSAALSVALLRALIARRGIASDDAAVCAGAYELAKVFHRYPSGIDNTVATYGGLLAFQRDIGMRRAAAVSSLPFIVAIGRAPRATRATVTALRDRWAADAATCEAIF